MNTVNLSDRSLRIIESLVRDCQAEHIDSLGNSTYVLDGKRVTVNDIRAILRAITMARCEFTGTENEFGKQVIREIFGT